MAHLTTRHQIVYDKDGKTERAAVVVCPCGSETFNLFRILTGDSAHAHIICTNCSTTFCQGEGTCGETGN